MIYERCPATLDVITSSLRCVMFRGHKCLSKTLKHNFGGLGPYTPGMNPQAYVDTGSTYIPWWRRVWLR